MQYILATTRIPPYDISPTIRVPNYNMLHTTRVPSYNILPTIRVPSCNILPTTSVPSYNILPTTRVPSYNILPTIRVPSYNILPTIRVPSYNISAGLFEFHIFGQAFFYSQDRGTNFRVVDLHLFGCFKSCCLGFWEVKVLLMCSYTLSGWFLSIIDPIIFTWTLLSRRKS